MGEAPEFVAVGNVPEVVAVWYTPISPGLVQGA